MVPDAENTGAKRYVQHDELRYALRSAHRHAPWIRRIFIVTDRQRPAWLAEHPKVTVVDHREIIPAELLSSVSSACIEGYLDRIPGLAERFIYGNDDMFFNRRARPKDFFDDSGRPIVRIARPYVSEAEAAAMAQSRPWEQTLYAAWRLFTSRAKPRTEIFFPEHSYDALTKTLWREALTLFPEFLERNRSPFRTGREISRVLLSYFMTSVAGCACVRDRRTNGKIKRLLIRAGLLEPGVFTVVHDGDDRALKEIRRLNPKTFCLNNIRDENAAQAIRFCEGRFPDPAPWERSKGR